MFMRRKKKKEENALMIYWNEAKKGFLYKAT